MALHESSKRRLLLVSRLLDSCFVIPGTQIRFGWDSLIGLIPGWGDLLGALLSLYFIVEGIRLRLPIGLLLRMLLNIFIELVIGIIPIIGDYFDVIWKSNQKNANLILNYFANIEKSSGK